MSDFPSTALKTDRSVTAGLFQNPPRKKRQLSEAAFWLANDRDSAIFGFALDDDMAAMLTLDSPTGRNGPTSDSTYEERMRMTEAHMAKLRAAQSA